ncbi:MAG: hypothetical protein JNK48_06635 [Bryobacterales bacterium]|nr:hypothetical protein [Bryobacterales bacterium]
MRVFVGSLLIAGLCSGAEFFSGMAARAVIGQRTFTAQQPASDQEVIGAASGIAYANGTLIVVDDNRVSALPRNNRILIYRNIRQAIPNPTDEIPINNIRCQVCVGKADQVLGQPDFTKNEVNLSRSGMQHPTSVATDGRILAVADTDNNRVLIWNSIPTQNNQPADIVLGQPDFTTARANEGGQLPTQRSFRGPQGVWIQGTRLFVADTSNNRILIWRTIPTQNYQPADVVLGQSSFTAFAPQDLSASSFQPKANTLLTPVSVTSDGTRVFVSDLGYNRVLVWNRIPDTNGASADVVIGQANMDSGEANDAKGVCPDQGTTVDNVTTYPAECYRATMDFPRYALSDGTRLFIADGGNDRILIYNTIPTRNGQRADVIVGQIASNLNQVSDSANPLGRASSDSVAAPMSLAWDGENLYVSDPFRRRILVFTPGEVNVPYTGVRNLFSKDVFAIGTITLGGTLKENDELTLKIGDPDATDAKKQREYKYKVVKDDSFTNIVNAFVTLINSSNNNAGDPQVLATPNLLFGTIVLTSRISGEEGNSVEFSTSTSDGATIVSTTSGATLSGGRDAAKIAPGTLVTILGDNLSDETVSAPEGIDPLPKDLGGVQVYFDGIRAPLLMVSPTEIRAQVPWEVSDANSISAYVRIRRKSGLVVSTAAVAVPIIFQNPGILAEDGTDPRPGIVTHFSSNATATVSIDGTANPNDVAVVVIEDREYSYTVKENDTLESILNGLIAAINANPEEKVEAFTSGVFTRLRLRAKVAGPEGNGIKISTRVADTAQVILTATNSETCCANSGGSRVTIDNPALPGETIVVLATGLGFVDPQEAVAPLATGFKYTFQGINRPKEFVSSLAAAKTANVLYSGLAPGLVGIYEVHLELNSDIPTNPATQLTIAQDIYVSNIITFPVFNPREGSTVTP